MTEQPARLAAARYVAAVNAGDLDGLRRLFAEDAVLRHPSGVFHGTEAISAFYRDAVFAFSTRVAAVGWSTAGDRCQVALDGTSPIDPTVVVAMLDTFTVDGAGRITELVIEHR